MRLSPAGLLASACLGVTVLAEVGAIVLPWALRSPYDSISFALYETSVVAVGVLIVTRLPRNLVGWFLCVFATQQAVTSDLATAWGVRALHEGWVGAQLALWVGLVSWAPGALMWVLALLYTPSGRLSGRRWRIAVAAGVGGTAAYMVGWWFSPASVNTVTREGNRFAVDSLPAQQLATLGGTLLCSSAAAAFASLAVRFRGADRFVRQQLKWVGLAGALLALFLPAGVALWSVSPIVRVMSPMVLTAMALALGAAVLRYRLFDVDLIILRTAAYVVASALVVAVYATVSVVLGAVMGRSEAWQVAAATLTAAAVFRPVLRGVRLALDRRFDRDSHAARLQVDAFLERLRAGTDQADRIEDVLRDALHEPRLRVLVFLPAAGGFVDLRGRPAVLEPGLAVLRIERAQAPEAIVQYVDTGDPVRQTRIRHLVEHGRLALQVTRLSVELSRQLDELDRSRARISQAADDERRRIQRDLHDGAQQRLVTIGLALRAMQGRLRAGSSTGEAERVDGMVAELAATIQELRTLTLQLPPPQLDSGIAAAFRELAGRAPIPVVVDADVERLDRSVEATAYFVGCEGLTNVIKHARATVVTMRAVRRNGSLVVCVADDGVGGARAREGSGLSGLADRVAAVGGRLHIESAPRGTLLTAELPCE